MLGVPRFGRPAALLATIGRPIEIIGIVDGDDTWPHNSHADDDVLLVLRHEEHVQTFSLLPIISPLPA